MKCPICNKELKEHANSLNTHLNTHIEYVSKMIDFSCKMFVKGYKFKEISKMNECYFSPFWISLRVKENQFLVDKYLKKFKSELADQFKNGFNCNDITKLNRISKHKVLEYLKDELGEENFSLISKKNKNLKTSNSLEGRKITEFNNRKRACKSCENIFYSNVNNLCLKCKQKHLNEQKFKEKEFLSDFVICPYCNYKLSLISSNHLKKHNKTPKDMFREYGDDTPYYSLNWYNNKIENLSDYNSLNSFYDIYHKGKNFKFKSSWEVDCFNLLIQMKIDFKYEELAIEYKHPIRECKAYYLPDFYLPKQNILIEVKPDAFISDIVAQEKKRASIELGYNFYFVNDKLINKDFFQNLINNN